MKIICQTTICLAIAFGFIACHTSYQATDLSQRNVNSNVENWPARPKEAATTLMNKYGQPDEMTASMIVWRDKGPWKKTVLMRDEISHDFPMPHTDFLQQTINYKVDPDKYDDLARFDGSVVVERTKGTLSARCDKEEMNFLALNLANDIITGKKTVEEARDYYAKTARKFKEGGTDTYLQGLQFTVAQQDSQDKDTPAKMQ
jgi:hypothetical protein